MTSAFKKIAEATPTEGGNIIRDGNYKLLIERVFVNNGYNGECFIAEFRVVESAPSGAVDDAGRAIVPNAVNSTASQVCLFKQGDVAYNNAKKIILAATAGLGYKPEQITPDVMGKLCSEANPLRGVAVAAETYRGVNKGRNNPANAGKPLTLIKWKPIEQTAEQLEAQKKFLDTNAAKVEMAATSASAPAQAAAPAAQSAPVSAPSPVGGLLGAILGGGR